MPQCCAFGCFNDQTSGKLFHRIPSEGRNKERRKIWLLRIGRKNWTPSPHARLCEDHFTKDQYEQNRVDGRRKLKPNAVPSVFCHRSQLKRKNPDKTETIVHQNKRKKPAGSAPSTSCSEAQITPTPRSNANNVKNVNYSSTSTSKENLPESSSTEVEAHCSSQGNANFGESALEAVSIAPGTSKTFENTGVQCSILSEKTSRENMQSLRRKLALFRVREAKSRKELGKLIAGVKQAFNDDQLSCLQQGSVQGTLWSPETIQKSLKLRLSCGPTGYASLRDMGQPLPCERTLQMRLETINFTPGVLEDLFPLLEVKTSFMTDVERQAALLIDHMSLTPSVEYDASTDLIIGKPTIPSSTGMEEGTACHGLVFTLSGISSRWKQTVCYHLTGTSFCPKEMKKITFDLITKCERLGFEINCIILDLDGENQEFLQECGIVVGSHSVTKNFCLHPNDSERKLFFMLDPPHILKNICHHLVLLHTMKIPPELVSKHKLPSDEVTIQPVQSLFDLSEHLDLKLESELRESIMNPPHQDKMKIRLTLSLISHEVASIIEHFVEKKKLDKCALTTAWFLRTIFNWFKLISACTRKWVLSNHAETKGQESEELLKEVSFLFEKMKISSSEAWTPVQSAVVLSTMTTLDLQKAVLEKKGYDFLLLGHFIHDGLRDLISQVLRNSAIPSVKSFKQALHLISISQFFQEKNHGSYFPDDTDYFCDFLKKRRDAGATDMCDLENDDCQEDILKEIAYDDEISEPEDNSTNKEVNRT